MAATTRADWAEHRLRTAILTGELEPGARIRIEQLAAAWQLSPTPLREAVRSLAHTGLVELTGKDSKLGSSVKAKMNMAMTEMDGGTTVTVVTDADVLGKIGQYGHGMISKRADSMFADFTSCVKTQLEQR